MFDSCNYNNLYTTGANLAYVGGTNCTSISALYNVVNTGSDVNSTSSSGAFTSSTNLAPSLSNPTAWTINNMGYPLGAVTDDINGNNRSITVATGAPDIGAYSFGTPSAAAPTAVVTGSHSVNGTEEIFFANKKVAEIIWGSTGTLPTIVANFYPGVWPDTANVGVAGAKFCNAYWKVDATGGSGYTYDITLVYDPAQLGTLPNESDIRMCKRPGSGSAWTAYLGSLTTVNTGTKTITVTGLNSFSEFSMTDQNNPLPVEWLNINAVKAGKDIAVNWTTSTEINNDRFEIERSVNGVDFEKVGEKSGAGNSFAPKDYHFTDVDAAITLSGTVYYRIKQIDFNNSFEYSKMVAVDLSGSATVKGVESVYPNPFNNYVTLQISTTAEEKVPYTITDQFGKVVYSGLVSVTSGTGVYSIDGLNSLAQGVYIISINGKAFSSQHKVTKF
jgi:hypothetical protein